MSVVRPWLALLLAAASLPLQANTLAPAQGTAEVAFTPWDDAEGLLVKTLGNARQAIQVQAYLLTSRPVALALLAARERGVAVSVMADGEQYRRGEYSLLPLLAAGGIPVRLETRYAAAHNKIVVVDADGEHPVVVTGSYNFTWSAQARNAENLLVLKDDPALARAYRDNWQRHWAEAEPFKAGRNGKSGNVPGRDGGARDWCALLTNQERQLLGESCRH